MQGTDDRSGCAFGDGGRLVRWDDLLDGLRRGGYEPEELDFMDNYGPIVRQEHRKLEGRRVRCMLGVARIQNGIRFETYLFSSPDEAEEFHGLAGTSPGWFRVQNVVVKTEPDSTERLAEVLGQAIGESEDR